MAPGPLPDLEETARGSSSHRQACAGCRRYVLLELLLELLELPLLELLLLELLLPELLPLPDGSGAALNSTTHIPPCFLAPSDSR